MPANSLRNTIFRSIFIISGILLVVFTLFISALIYKSGKDNAFAIIRQRNLAMKNYILWYFMPLRNTVEALSENPTIKKGSKVTSKDKQEILELYKIAKDMIPNINYIYSGYEDKNLFINDYTPPAGFNPTTRPWYIKALESHPYVSDGIPYQEIKDKSWLVSISKTITDVNGKIVGVLAIDTSLQHVMEQISASDFSLKTSYSYVINRNHVLIMHHDKQYLNHSLSTLITPQPDFKEQEGSFSYSTIDGISKIAYYHRIDELGWILVTVVNKNEILLPLIFKITLVLGVVLIAAVVLGIITSNMLITNLVRPLVELENYLTNPTKNEKQIQYPDNEIGRLARAIQNITDEELYKKNQQLMDMNAQLELLSITDPLTGLYNRRKILQDIERESLRVDRYNCNASILIFDIDHFKTINDNYGHIEGDLILKELGELIKSLIRTTDVFGRWGGEEFIILFPETNLASAAIIAEKLRKAVEEHIFTNGKNITISIGVGTLIKGRKVEEVIKEADNMLYRAKESGRNRVEYINKENEQKP